MEFLEEVVQVSVLMMKNRIRKAERGVAPAETVLHARAFRDSDTGFIGTEGGNLLE